MGRGWVDVTSRLGWEMLHWVEGDGPYPQGSGTPQDEREMMVGRPIYPGVPQGWVWPDRHLNRLLPLTEQVFWDRVMGRLLPRAQPC